MNKSIPMTLEDILIITTMIIFVLICTGLMHMCPQCRKWFSLNRRHLHGYKGYVCKHCKYEHKM